MNNDPLYREIVLEHWENPRNYGVVKKPDIDMSEVNPTCGDKIRITAKIKNKKIAEIMFISDGCAVSKAAASMLTEMIKGKTVGEFKKMAPEIFLNEFAESLSPGRVKCALLGFSTLKQALIAKH